MDTLLHLVARAVDENGIDPDNIDFNTTDPRIIDLSMEYCTVGKCPKSWQMIEYQPTMAGNIIYMVFFVALFSGQLWFGVRNKTWTYMGTMLVGLIGEIAGYIGRVLLHSNPFSMDYFLFNLIPLTIAPALLTAGIYLCLSRVIVAKGSENSRIKPKMYTYIFIGCDFLSLLLQGIGGGMAATADDHTGTQRGVNIMIAGLISQVVTMSTFLAIWGDFILSTRRSRKSGTLASIEPALYSHLRASKTFRYFQWSLFVATIFIFVRSIYRVAELWEGFDGHLANDQVTFMIFEGPMIILAVSAMTIFHPGRVFGNLWNLAGKGVTETEKLGDDGVSVPMTDFGDHTTANRQFGGMA